MLLKIIYFQAEFKKAAGAEYDANKKPAGGAPVAASPAASNSGDMAIWQKE